MHQWTGRCLVGIVFGGLETFGSAPDLALCAMMADVDALSSDPFMSRETLSQSLPHSAAPELVHVVIIIQRRP